MTNKELKKQVLKHWNENLETLILNYLSDTCLSNEIHINSSYCAFCEEYLNDGCIGCPIYEKTGEILCYGSPYLDVFMWRYNNLEFAKGLEVIMKEINFLEQV